MINDYNKIQIFLDNLNRNNLPDLYTVVRKVTEEFDTSLSDAYKYVVRWQKEKQVHISTTHYNNL